MLASVTVLVLSRYVGDLFRQDIDGAIDPYHLLVGVGEDRGSGLALLASEPGGGVERASVWFRPSSGGWYILKSSANYTTSVGVSWGLSTDVPVPGDFDGDGKIDPAVFRPSTGGWYVLKSSTNYTTSFGVSWGLSTDLPILKRP